MLDNVLVTLPQRAVEAIPIAIVGWLGIWLLFRAAGSASRMSTLGGPYTFLTVWGLAVLAQFNSHRMAVPAVQTLYFSLLGIGFLVCLIAMTAEALRRLRRDRRGLKR